MIIETNRIPAEFSGSTLKALCHLAEVGEARIGDLAKAARVSTAASTGLVDRAKQRGLVERIASAEDRRSIVIRLTQLGLDRVEAMKPEEEVAA